MRAVITLTTDFGTVDTYVGAMKGVILGINPEATIVDICHDIEPQNLAQAAFLVSTAYPYYPPGSIHVVVVDPGVGSARRAILLATPSASFIAPDNGVLTHVLIESTPQAPEARRRGTAKTMAIGPGLQAFALTERRFWRPTVSSTFHGRDIFAPVAAHLSLGVPPSHFGGPLSSLTVIPLPQRKRRTAGMTGHIIHIDHFGNLITDIMGHDLPKEDVAIEVRGQRIQGLSPSYAEGGKLLALIGSSSRLEIAARNDSAAWQLGARTGDEVRVVQSRPGEQRRA